MKKQIKISFLAYVNEKDFESVVQGFEKYGTEIFSTYFSELENVGCFKVQDITNSCSKKDWAEDEPNRVIENAREIKIETNADIEDSDLAYVTYGFNDCGADIIGEKISELWDIGCFELN